MWMWVDLVSLVSQWYLVVLLVFVCLKALQGSDTPDIKFI